MSNIQLLNQSTINKIAAGEVVERPASVVKELVENAIDASATGITIEIKEGGLKFIRVTDNGSGISKSNVKIAFLRHATSKIRIAKDLTTVMSLGFRGEALASIGSVSMVELITKESTDITGVRYIIEGGMEKSYEEIGVPSGTTIIVKNLFYNTPARLKFMKAVGTEYGYISDMVTKIAMGHPEIGFKLISNNKIKLHTTGKNNLNDCIYSIYGKEVIRNLIRIDRQEGDISIHGYIGKPSISRGNRTYENYYINGRYIKSRLIEKAIESGFKNKLMLHQYPFVILHISLLGSEVDVNVHPTKMEVRFGNEEAVYTFIYTTIIEALYKQVLIPDETIEKKEKESIDTKRKYIKEPFQEVNESVIKHKPTSHSDKNIKILDLKNIELDTYKKLTDIPSRENKETNIMEKESMYNGEQIEVDSIQFMDKKYSQSHKIIGQLFNTYWIVELEDKYYIIDQHAAHEKVLYENMINKIEGDIKCRQKLLAPLVVELSPNEWLRYKGYTDFFDKLGFDIESFGETSVIIRWVPFIFDKIMDASQFLFILDGLEDVYTKKNYEVLLDDVASMACKTAVKGGKKLSIQEYEQLIEDLLTLENPYTCPHGRPAIIAMTKYELEKKFKRIQ